MDTHTKFPCTCKLVLRKRGRELGREKKETERRLKLEKYYVCLLVIFQNTIDTVDKFSLTEEISKLLIVSDDNQPKVSQTAPFLDAAKQNEEWATEPAIHINKLCCSY